VGGDHNSVIFVNSYLMSRLCKDRMRFIIDYHEGHHGCFHNCGSVVTSGDSNKGHFPDVVVLGGPRWCWVAVWSGPVSDCLSLRPSVHSWICSALGYMILVLITNRSAIIESDIWCRKSTNESVSCCWPAMETRRGQFVHKFFTEWNLC
jgi:hypothetical protein